MPSHAQYKSDVAKLVDKLTLKGVRPLLLEPVVRLLSGLDSVYLRATQWHLSNILGYM